MTHISTLFSKHRLTTAFAAVVVFALGVGGYVMVSSDSIKGMTSSPTNTAAAPLQQNASVSQTPAETTDASNGLSTAKVIPFQQGAPSPATPVGQIPAGFKDGDGTLVTGTAADKAEAAAVATFPGVNTNRVSVLSDGEYNVHIIGVNWPHHVFVNQNFIVVGAE
jgi:hypothetical protein